MSNLSQINIQFKPADDRLLLLLKTNKLAEFRFWMTRRFVKSLWPALVNCLANNEAVAGQTQKQAKQTVLSFQHESAVAKSNFDANYESQVASTPLGTEPLLLTRANLKRNEHNQPVLGLYPESGQGIELAVDEPMLHSFCKLLSQTVAKASWDMSLGFGTTAAAVDSTPHTVN